MGPARQTEPFGRSTRDPSLAEALVSVVTPVHNGAEYLGQCIESVLAQTHANWVHVIADNASTDASPEIAERYARQDSRITLVRSEEFVDVNSSLNRAFSLTHPQSRWCKAVLADDWVYPECLERMLGSAARSESIGIVSAYQRWGDRVHLAHFAPDEEVLVGSEALARIFTDWFNVTGNPTAVMVRTDIVLAGGPFYDGRLEQADTDAAYRILVDHDLGFVHQVLSYARSQGGSRTTWVQRVGASFPEGLIRLVRYGPQVLDDATYQRVKRAQVRRYATYQLKQSLRPSRFRDGDFLDFHVRAVANLRDANTSGDREIEALARLVTVLLSRRRIGGVWRPR